VCNGAGRQIDIAWAKSLGRDALEMHIDDWGSACEEKVVGLNR